MNGSHPLVGYRWWQWYDNYGQCDNYGLTTISDDLYDGKQPARTVTADEFGISHGGWPLGGYTDFISHFRQANRVYLEGIRARRDMRDR
jgi:hypothetical protein